VLRGDSSAFAQIDALANNQGTFHLQGGRDFDTAGHLTNSGLIRLDRHSVLTVAGTYTQSAGGRLKGKGKLVATTFVNSGAIGPGDSPGLLEIEGSFVQDAAGTLEIEIGGAMAEDEHDVLSIIGTATLGGSVNASLIDAGGGPFQPDPGDMFTVLTATEGLTGVFEELRILNPLGDRYIRGKLNYTASDVTLEILNTHFLAADFNEDNQVDAVDLGLWKGSFGLTTGADHLHGDADGDRDVDGYDWLVWQRQLGRTTPPSTTTGAAVPEPRGGAMGVLAALAALIVWRPRA
jgi:hypothetical protein